MSHLGKAEDSFSDPEFPKILEITRPSGWAEPTVIIYLNEVEDFIAKWVPRHDHMRDVTY